MQQEADQRTANAGWEIDHFELLKKEQVNEAVTLKLHHLPSSLFRYRSLLSDYDLENIKNQQFYLAHPDEMNDPYESAFTWDYRKLSDDVLKDGRIWEMGKGFYGTLSKAEIIRVRGAKDSQREILKLVEEKNPNSVGLALMDSLLTQLAEEQGKMMQQKLEKQVKDGIKFCCFSSRNDSILMWSHYADQHKGICVEYNFDQYRLKNSLYPVHYSDQVTDIGKYLVRKEPSMIVPVLAVVQKALDWHYEREWRLAITHGIMDQNFVYSPRPIAIYLGTRISAENKGKVVALCRALNIPAVQMSKDLKAFRISSAL